MDRWKVFTTDPVNFAQPAFKALVEYACASARPLAVFAASPPLTPAFAQFAARQRPALCAHHRPRRSRADGNSTPLAALQFRPRWLPTDASSSFVVRVRTHRATRRTMTVCSSRFSCGTQRYITMPLCAWTSRGPDVLRVALVAWRSQGAQFQVGKVWPGFVLFPDWTHPNTPGWWYVRVAIMRLS